MCARLGIDGAPTGRPAPTAPHDPERERVATLRVEGTEGDLMVLNPLAPQIGNLLVLTTAEGEEHESVEQTSTYLHQLVAFRDAVAGG